MVGRSVMPEDTHSEARSYTVTLSNIIGRYITPKDYEVKLGKDLVDVTAGPHRFSFRAVLLNDQDLSELNLALQEAQSSGQDLVEELAVQLGHIEELAVQLGYPTDRHDRF